MTRLSKILLAISVVTFVAALTDVGSSIVYGLLKPMSAIFFMLFFIINLFAREMALYDEEQRRRLNVARSSSDPARRSRNGSSPVNRQSAALTAAHSH